MVNVGEYTIHGILWVKDSIEVMVLVLETDRYAE